METISFSEFSKLESSYLNEMVYELLLENNINAETFAFSIEVEYSSEK